MLFLYTSKLATCLDHNPETLGKDMKTDNYNYMTAAEALGIATRAQDEGNEKSKIQVLVMLDVVKSHAEDGKTDVTLYGHTSRLSTFARAKLKLLGFTVIESDTQRDGYSVTVSWGE